jgi:hydrogenase maturation protein HypF
VSDQVAPGLDELGLMLPYSPVHHLLFARLADGSAGAPDVLVMTSGNRSGEPLCLDNAEADERLAGIADGFLVHDREIAVPCDDSVLAWSGAGPVPVRRSRGFAPLPVAVPGDGVVLAVGAELKNTFALARDGLAFVSAHVGDLGTLESRAAYARATAQLLGFHRATPSLVVADLHPAYASRAWAVEYAAEHGVPLHDLQHHHAHLASLAAEHGRLDEELLGVVFDGTGYGCDATVWGGEFLVLTDGGLRADRVGHLGTVRLAGGDTGVRNPVRQAALALLAAGVDPRDTPVGAALTEAELTILPGVLESGRWVPTSSVGRLFDIVAAILGVRARVTYEAQAAIELEALARRWRRTSAGAPHHLTIPTAAAHGVAVLEPDPLVRDLVAALDGGVSAGELAWAFHQALAGAACGLAVESAAARGLGTIGLSGGVFTNRLLLAEMVPTLVAAGFEVLTHRQVPAGDGGLSLGQVAVGVRALRRAGSGDLVGGGAR